jgi:hypothetical protein
MPKGFIDQRVGGSMIATLTSIDLYEQLTAVFLGYALH